MVKVVGVRFKRAGKIYYFDPDEFQIEKGMHIIVETARGVELGEVVIPPREVPDEEIVAPLKKVMRIATEDDEKHAQENRKKEKDAFGICLQKIRDHNLEMKLIDVEYTFDNNKILFYFTADGRIELRQIGVRDESKMMGGIGVCGRELCCCSHLGEFQPVSIKMAKEQGLSLNPTKISGNCGRLMCCLRYEQEAYEQIIKYAPRIGAVVETPDGQGVVIERFLLKETAKVKLDKGNETDLRSYRFSELKVIQDASAQEENDVEDAEIEELKALED